MAPPALPAGPGGVSGTPSSVLLESLQAFLREELQPQLSGFSAYNTRVAANLLAILSREQELGPALAALDRDFAATRGLPLEDLPRQLALALRDGRLQPDPELLRYLRRRSLLAMAIDNPRYAGYRRARACWPEEDLPCTD